MSKRPVDGVSSFGPALIADAASSKRTREDSGAKINWADVSTTLVSLLPEKIDLDDKSLTWAAETSSVLSQTNGIITIDLPKNFDTVFPHLAKVSKAFTNDKFVLTFTSDDIATTSLDATWIAYESKDNAGKILEVKAWLSPSSNLSNDRRKAYLNFSALYSILVKEVDLGKRAWSMRRSAVKWFCTHMLIACAKSAVAAATQEDRGSMINVGPFVKLFIRSMDAWTAEVKEGIAIFMHGDKINRDKHFILLRTMAQSYAASGGFRTVCMILADQAKVFQDPKVVWSRLLSRSVTRTREVMKTEGKKKPAKVEEKYTEHYRVDVSIPRATQHLFTTEEKAAISNIVKAEEAQFMSVYNQAMKSANMKDVLTTLFKVKSLAKDCSDVATLFRKCHEDRNRTYHKFRSGIIDRALKKDEKLSKDTFIRDNTSMMSANFQNTDICTKSRESHAKLLAWYDGKAKPTNPAPVVSFQNTAVGVDLNLSQDELDAIFGK